MFTTRALVLVSIVLLLLVSYFSSVHAWWEQRQEINALQAEYDARQEAIKDLSETKERWKDEAYVQQQARERFGWVMPGETGYRVIGVDGKVQGDVAELDAPPEGKRTPWYDTLWGSVGEAGKRESASKPEDGSSDDAPAQAPSDDDRILRN